MSESKITKKDEYEKAMKKSQEIYRVLKKSLKPKSKSELINIIINYGSDLQEMQAIAQKLLEENKELKGEKSK